MEIQSLCTESGLFIDIEPFGLFSHLIPAAAYLETGHLHHHRERQGLLPDFLIASPSDHGHQAAQLCELKLISAGATYYKSGSGDRSVDVRARQLPRLYQDKAKNIDRNYCGNAEGQVGPVQRRLEQFGDLAGFVIGQFGEGSHDLHQYLIKCADSAVSPNAWLMLQEGPSQILKGVSYSSSSEDDFLSVPLTPNRLACCLAWGTWEMGPRPRLSRET